MKGSWTMERDVSRLDRFFRRAVIGRGNLPVISGLALCCFSVTSFASGPDPDPFRDQKRSARGEPEFVVRSFVDKAGKGCDQASFVLGNKRVSVREDERGMSTRHDDNAVLMIFVNDKPNVRISLPGRYKVNGKRRFGYPFGLAKGTKPEFKIDKVKKTLTYLKKYPLPDGNIATFSYVLKSLGNSKIEWSWDLGISQKQLDAMPDDFATSVWISLQNYRGDKIVVGGKEITQATKKKLLEKLQHKWKFANGYKPVVVASRLDYSKVVIAPDNKLKELSIGLEGKYNGAARESVKTSAGKEYYALMLFGSPAKRLAKDSLIIDLGECALRDADAPPPVGGIDFYKADRIHVPKMPTRNLMPNPSFEQGLRYWCWMFGGAKYTPGEDRKRFVIDDTDAKFGKKSLLMRASGSLGALSFPLPFKKGQTYTVSCYAKGLKGGETLGFCPISIRGQSQFSHRMRRKKSSHFKLTKDWKRCSYTFTQKAGANAVYLGNSGDIRVDGLQVEVGKKTTPFTCAPVEGLLTTSNRDNNLEYGKPIDAVFHLMGKKGTKGKVTLKIFNFYRETLFEKQYKFKVGDAIKLPLDAKKLGTGMFFVRAKYEIKGMEPYYDFYRFSIMKFLQNKHATSSYFSNLPTWIGTISRSEDLTRYLMQWGIGCAPKMRPDDVSKLPLLRKYGSHTPSFGILYHSPKRFLKGTTAEDTKFMRYIMYKATKITPEDEKRLEQIGYNIAKNYPEVGTWFFANETECHSPIVKAGKFDEWAKVQIAFYRGFKRGNPKARVMPDSGTSGFNPLRGQKETEGYLKATQGKVKWDVISTHIYGNIDGTGERGRYDADEMTQYLIKLMDKYGCGDAAIQYAEGFLVSALRVPEWHTQSSLYFHGPNPSYDIANQEYVQACLASRLYIIGLKYWPKLEHINPWLMMIFQDINFTPISVVKAINTMGNLLQNPKYVADVRPANGVRGYVFKENGQGLAAVWCAIDKVEDGYVKGPVMRIKYKGKAPELIDLMGNVRPIKEKGGFIDIQLTPAPLFIRGGDPKELAKMLKDSIILGGDANIVLRFVPSNSGSVKMDIANVSGREQKGTVKLDGKTYAFDLAGNKTEQKVVVPDGGCDLGKMYTFKHDYSVLMKDCPPLNKSWNMHYFYAKQVSGKPDWSKIPAVTISNRHVRKDATKTGSAEARFKVAYDKDNLYLHVECEKPELKLNEKGFSAPGYEKYLYKFDGCLEVYIDTGADGMSNTTKGYDANDYRFDFSMGNPKGKTGRGLVYRLKDVDLQLAGGIDFPSKAEAAKGVKCEFIRTAKGFAYEITFPQRYIEPFALKKGNIAGFGLYLHDKSSNRNPSLATKPGEHCNFRPDLWPIIILK